MPIYQWTCCCTTVRPTRGVATPRVSKCARAISCRDLRPHYFVPVFAYFRVLSSSLAVFLSLLFLFLATFICKFYSCYFYLQVLRTTLLHELHNYNNDSELNLFSFSLYANSENIWARCVVKLISTVIIYSSPKFGAATSMRQRKADAMQFIGRDGHHYSPLDVTIGTSRFTPTQMGGGWITGVS